MTYYASLLRPQKEQHPCYHEKDTYLWDLETHVLNYQRSVLEMGLCLKKKKTTKKKLPVKIFEYALKQAYFEQYTDRPLLPRYDLDMT